MDHLDFDLLHQFYCTLVKGDQLGGPFFFLSFQIVLSDCTFEPDFVKI